MAIPCQDTSGSQILAQQMFLGASIVSFSSNLGWGGSSSSLNIELVNDFGSFGDCYITNNPDLEVIKVNDSSSFDGDNHYYTCTGNSCYVDEKGELYNTNSKTKIVPGKVYHVLRNDGLVSRYWRKHDPGFFGDATLINPDGQLQTNRINEPLKYNIIGTPAIFRYGYFTFGGIIQSWEKNINNGPRTYTVSMVSADDLLSRCYVILDNYTGSIFTKFNSSFYGSPTNSSNTGNPYGSLKQGNIPNVFNVYGFLESYKYGFSQKNDRGIPIEFIIRALSVLTSSDDRTLPNKAHFSPFGRIIAPAPVTDNPNPVIANFGDYSFGLCNTVLDNFGISRCEFILDLSELPIPPRDIRLDTSNSIISIIDLIRQICDKTGRDFYTTIIRKAGKNIIKIKTVNRTIPLASNTITNVINTLTSANIKTTSVSIGEEHNVATPKVLYIGANQQRLYQAKNYLLGYMQSSYIYNPITNQFIVFRDIGSAKIPAIYSTRNISLSNQIIGTDITNIFSAEQRQRSLNPDSIDTLFKDTDVSSGPTSPIFGSYIETVKYDDSNMYQQKRYIPLFKNSISPFFGYRFNETIQIENTDGNTYRFIRPVFYDIWTGQLVVNMTLQELPLLSIGNMPNVYTYQTSAGLPANTGDGLNGTETTSTSSNTSQPPPDTSALNNFDPDTGENNTEENQDEQSDTGENNTEENQDEQSRVADPASARRRRAQGGARKSVNRNSIGFTITESEIRAAMAGWESYLAYCLAKNSLTKPEIFTMLVYTYNALGKLIGPSTPPVNNEIGSGPKGMNGTPASSINTAGEAKQNSGKAVLSYKQLGLDFNFFLNHEFIKDLKIISDFISKIGEEFYGKKYLVRLPKVSAYRDRTNPDISIPVQGNSVSVYQGSGKIYFSYEPVDGAWEEYGNFIDGEIVVGSPNYYKLIDQNNLIRPLLGYNASYKEDFVTKKLCENKINNTAEYKKKLEIPSSAPPTSSTADSLAALNKYGKSIQSCGSFLVPSLDIHSLSDYVLTTVPGTVIDAFNNTVPGAIRQKLYVPANVSKEIAFFDPLNLIDPVAIIEGQGIDVYSASNSYASDPNLTVASNAALEDFAFLAKIKTSSNWSSVISRLGGVNGINNIQTILLASIMPLDSSGYLVTEGDTANVAANHYRLAPKKAQPIYAGVPLKSNIDCYGPWTNYPALANQATLFPGIEDTTNLLENMISDVKIEKKDDLNPWTYGGMSFLDQAVIYDIINYLSYQTRLEQGSLTIGSLPVFGLAGNLSINTTDSDYHEVSNPKLKFMGFNYTSLVAPPSNGLVISNLNLNISNSNISTSYGFRTYSPKLGLFSKENSDRIKEFRNSVSVFNRQIADTSKNLENSVRKQINSIIESSKKDRKSTSIASFESKIYAASPAQMIIGNSSHYIPSATGGVISQTGISNSWAGLFVPDEALAELTKQFSSKSVMSMDGLFSPVSLYPTNMNSTFAISSRAITTDLSNRNITCPKCNGTGKITDSKLQQNSIVWIEFPCPLCTKSKILGYDPTNIVDNDAAPLINFRTLNPISLSSGEFRNTNAQSGDGSRNNIRVIGRSEIVPTGDKSNLDSSIHINDPIGADISFGEIDRGYNTVFNTKILNNHRFFAHRGPLMVHGWGYDTEGYPVPNEADEPKEFDADGRPKRFFLTSSGTNDLTQDGAFLPSDSQKLGDIIGKGWEKNGGGWQRKLSNKFYLNWGERPDLWPIGPIDLRWDYDRKVWVGGDGGCNNADPPYIVAAGVDNTILSKFISNSTKINKKCSYKMVYAVLETDLIKMDNHLETLPTRAFLDDLEYGLKPLPENIRRLIYIVDRTGYSAPRGAKILVRYNSETGFYEPVSKQQYIVFGTINNNGTAVVELSYMPGYMSGDATYRTNISFANPLSLNPIQNNQGSSKGVFMYDNSRWNLISVG